MTRSTFEMGYQSVGACKYWFERKCSVCQTVGQSERRVAEGYDNPTIEKECDEFLVHLKQRGWSIAPLLCPKCRARLVTNTISEWLDDEERNGKLSLALKAGDSHATDSNV